MVLVSNEKKNKTPNKTLHGYSAILVTVDCTHTHTHTHTHTQYISIRAAEIAPSFA